MSLAKPIPKKTAAIRFAQGSASPRSPAAPEGYKRLTVNLPSDLHKRLKQAALDQDCTATDIIERALQETLR